VNPEDQPELGSTRQFKRAWIPSWAGFLLIALVVIVIFLFAMPAFITCRPAPTSGSINNLRNLGIFLFEFEDEFGSFPSPTTAAELAAKNNLPPLPTTTSNDLLTQLFVAELLESEEIFFSHHPKLPTRKPDNVITPPSRILEPGECGFSYVVGLSTASNGNAPILLAPMIPGTTTFDRRAYNGRAVALRVDQSVKQYPLDKSGRVILPNGLDLFDPAQPFWKGKTPDLRHPAH